MRQVVGVGDLKISASQGDSLVTYGLGSCLGMTLYDPQAKVGGLLHVVLPNSQVDPDKAKANPYVFVDTGVPSLFKQAYKLGAVKSRCEIKVVGGAQTAACGDSDHFQIGKRNWTALKKLLWRNGVMVAVHHVGGTSSRTVTMDMATGQLQLRIDGQTLSL